MSRPLLLPFARSHDRKKKLHPWYTDRASCWFIPWLDQYINRGTRNWQRSQIYQITCCAIKMTHVANHIAHVFFIHLPLMDAHVFLEFHPLLLCIMSSLYLSNLLDNLTWICLSRLSNSTQQYVWQHETSWTCHCTFFDFYTMIEHGELSASLGCQFQKLLSW